jgi:hypothetical protein
MAQLPGGCLLAPAVVPELTSRREKAGVKPGTLTIQKRLILEADATYKVTLDSRTAATDKVACLGASIRRASILFNDVGASVIPVGNRFHGP